MVLLDDFVGDTIIIVLSLAFFGFFSVIVVWFFMLCAAVIPGVDNAMSLNYRGARWILVIQIFVHSKFG